METAGRRTTQPASAHATARSTTSHPPGPFTIGTSMGNPTRKVNQFVKRRILTLRMRPNPARVDTSDDPP
jgi:septal ring-binding cell division protein DamX